VEHLGTIGAGVISAGVISAGVISAGIMGQEKRLQPKAIAKKT
jgi:TRAP-type mannitol/chloroaromatic compound transport system permease large subunit